MSKTGFYISEVNNNIIGIGDSYSVRVQLANNTSSQISSSVELDFGEGFSTSTVSITANSNEVSTVQESITIDRGMEPGKRRPTLSKISGEQPIIEYYDSSLDGDGSTGGSRLPRQSLQNAVDDWNNNDISDASIFALVQSYNNNKIAIIGESKVYDIISVNGPPDGKTVGEVLTWDVELKRVGDIDAPQGIKVDVGGLSVETGVVDVELGETSTVQVNLIATEDIIGNNSWTVEVSNNTQTGSVSVNSAPISNLTLSIDSINNPFIDGEFRLDGHISNDRESDLANETIRLTFSGGVFTESIDVNVPSNTQEEFTITKDLSTVSNVSAGENLVQVDSIDTSGIVVNGTTDIQADPKYGFSTVNGPTDGVEGDIFTWEVDVTNNGDGVATKPIRLNIESKNVRTEPVEIQPGNTESFEINFALGNRFVGANNWELVVGSDSASGSVSVSEAGNSKVTITTNSVNQPKQTEDLIVNLVLENITDEVVSDDVQLLIPTTDNTIDDEVTFGSTAGDDFAPLDPGDEQDIELRYTTTESEVGDLDFQVITETNPIVRTHRTSVAGIPVYNITNVDYPSQTNRGSFTRFDIDIENVGTATDSEFVTFDWETTGSTNDAEESFSVPVGNVKTKRIEFRVPEQQEEKETTFTISTNDDSFTDTILVEFSPVVNLNVEEIGYDEVKLNGDIIDVGEAEHFDIGFEIKTITDEEDVINRKEIVQRNITKEKQFSKVIENLQPSTDYEFRAIFETEDKKYYPKVNNEPNWTQFSTYPETAIFNLEKLFLTNEVEQFDEIAMTTFIENKGISAITEVAFIVDGDEKMSRIIELDEKESDKIPILFWDTAQNSTGSYTVQAETKSTQLNI